MMPSDPVFEPGDRVVDFKDNTAVVLQYVHVKQPGKSNRVRVRWDAEPDYDDKRMFYASVFKPFVP